MKRFADVCNGHCFVIPENQRGYSWEKKHVDAIFNDLLLAGSKAHYMGPIIVTRTDAPDFQTDDLITTAEFTLEDGQQRITTFFMIVNSIRMRFEELLGPNNIESQRASELVFYSSKGIHLRIKNKNRSLQSYLEYIILGNPAPGVVTPPMESMREVNSVIKTRFSKMDLRELKIWTMRIVNQAKFIWVDLANEGVNRYLTFDAINSRGLPLSEFDKIKNFCILVDQTRGLATNPDDEWYKAITALQKFGVASRGSEAAFIADLYCVFHDTIIKQDAVHSSFVDRYSELLSGPDAYLEGEFKSFVGLWKEYAESFGFITTRNRSVYYGGMCTKEAGSWLTRLDNMDLATVTRALLCSCYLRFSPSDFEKVVRACEIYTFRIHAVLGFRTNKNSNKIVKLSNDVLRLNKSFNYVANYICQWMKSIGSMQQFVSRLADGGCKYYYDANVKGWQYGYYFLYEYEVYYSPAGVGPLEWGKTSEDKINSIEHVLPQGHRDKGWWESHWPDETRAEKFKHRLGNLVLSVGNSALSRKSIDLKLYDPSAKHYYRHANATNTEKRIDNFTCGKVWKEENILRREYEMLCFALERWSIPCVDDNVTIVLPDEFTSKIIHDNSLEIHKQNAFGFDDTNGEDSTDEILEDFEIE